MPEPLSQVDSRTRVRPSSSLISGARHVLVTVEGEVDEHIGWIHDHKCISEAMNPLIDLLDHDYLNDIEGLESPTIEKMCAWFWRKIADRFTGLFEITIYETPSASRSFRSEF